MASIGKIVPCLWFDGRAEEAANHYVSIFENSRVQKITRYTEQGHEVHGQAPGSVLTVAFELLGTPFTALNAGPQFRFNEAISFQVLCETQEEIDRYWSELSAAGDERAQQCGWLKDRFGLSWQIVPAALAELIGDEDRTKAGRVMAAVLKMKKLDLGVLKEAHSG